MGWRLRAILIGIIFMSLTNTSCMQPKNPGPPGASSAFTTNDPVVKQAQALMNDGNFKEAQSLLASDDGHADAQVQEAREEMKEIIRRTRREYPLNASDLLTKIQKNIPDATPADVERWTKAGETENRNVDGEIRYYTREPVNIYRFSEEAKKRMSK